MPCAAPAVAARDAAPARARAARRLRRMVLCGPAQPAAAGSTAGAEFLRRVPAAAIEERQGQRGERHGLAARALSEMLCDESHAARCRATVQHRTPWHTPVWKPATGAALGYKLQRKRHA